MEMLDVCSENSIEYIMHRCEQTVQLCVFNLVLHDSSVTPDQLESSLSTYYISLSGIM